jgi:hypothetical protein
MKKIILLSLALFITQCATLGGTYEKEKVQKIKKIAVVGFTFDAPLETSDHLMSKLMGNEKDSGPGLMGSFKDEHAQKETANSKAVYENLVAGLKKVGWQIKSASEVRSSNAVANFYNKPIKIGMYPLEKGSGRYEKEGIPQYAHLSSMIGKGEFSKMAKDLGVDAIAAVHVKSQGSSSIPFVTNINHEASITMQIFDSNSDSLIMLFTSNGKKVKGSTKTKMGKEFEEDIQKGALASIDQFILDLKDRLKD